MTASSLTRVVSTRRLVAAGGLIALVGGALALGVVFGDRLRETFHSSASPNVTNPNAVAPLATVHDHERAAIRPAPFDHVHALGKLEPRGRLIRVAPPAGQESARVDKLFVAEGDAVAEGDVLARFDTWNRRQAAVAEAEAAKAAAEGRLAQTRAGAKPAEIAAQREQVDLLARQILVARKDFERARLLLGKKALSTEEYDNKQWELDRVVIEHRRAEQQLTAIAEVREIDIRVRELEVASAEAVLATARTNLEEAELRAPSVGRILKIQARPGEKVGEKGILELGDVDHMEAVAEVFEGDMSRLQLGQTAEVWIDGTGERLSGTLVELGHLVGRKVVLSNDPVVDTDARVLEVRIALKPEDARRVARLTNARIEARIEVREQRVNPGSEISPAGITPAE